MNLSDDRSDNLEDRNESIHETISDNETINTD